MEFIDTNAVFTLFAVVSIVAAVALVLIVAVLPSTLKITRRDRVARHESIPTYYGRLHFGN